MHRLFFFCFQFYGFNTNSVMEILSNDLNFKYLHFWAQILATETWHQIDIVRTHTN